MLSLLIWAAVLLACFGVGAVVVRRLGVGVEGPAEEIPFATGLGLGILAYLILALGLLGQLHAWLGVGLIAALALVGWRHVWRLMQLIGAALRGPKHWRWATLPLVVFFLASFALTLVGALAPATDLDYDGLVYHLAIPKLYLRHGRIHAVPWLSHSNFPFSLEMLYLLGLMLRDQALAKLFHFGCGWLTVCAIFAFGRRRWGARAGWLGAAVFAGIPLVAWEMMSAYNELAFALYAFLALSALSRWLDARELAAEPDGRSPAENGDGWLWVAAIMSGLALGTKMLAGVVPFFAVLALLWAWARGRAHGPMGWRVIAFAAIGAAVAAPWYVKSYLWTGNPVYPFFYEAFDGRYWTAQRAVEYTAAQKEFGLGSGPLAFLALPWNLTMHTRWFFDIPGHLRPVSVLVWVYGPLLLALLPVLLVTGPVGGAGRLALWFALTYTTVWFGMSQNGRYLMPILPGLSACAGLAAARMMDRRGLVPAAAVLALSLALLSGLHTSFGLAAPSLRVVVGTESQEDYLRASSSVYRLLEPVNLSAPPDARIMVLGGEPRLFYLDRDYLIGDHAAIFSESDLSSPAALLAALRRMGVTHLLLHARTLRDMAAHRGAMETRLAELAAQGEIRVVASYGTLSLWELAGAGS